MPVTATGTSIRAITGTAKTDVELNVFVSSANLKTARVKECNDALSDNELSAFADWYACYLLVAGGSDSTLGVSEEQIEQYKVKYGGTSGETTPGQRYWNTANDLSGGCLATLDKQGAQIAIL